MMRSIFFVLLLVTACDDQGCQQTESSCCKVCKDSKACGDSCIPNNQSCSKYSGCACNGETFVDAL